MGTHRANLRRLSPHYDMTAVPALPDPDLALPEDLLHLHIVEQGAIALLVVLLDGAHHAELGRQLREALLLRRFGKVLIHLGPLVVLSVRRGGQILRGGANALQLLEPHLGVFLLVFGGLQEQG